MKRLLLTLMLASGAVVAGDYYEARINSYDPLSGLYFKAVEGKVERDGFLGSKGSANTTVNINIFDPSTNQSRVLFAEPQKEGIAIVLFETGYRGGAIEFNGSTHHGLVMNNSDLQKREPRDKLLIGVRAGKSIDLFVASRRGENMKRLVSVPAGADWHIDVKNSKLRIVHPLENGLRFESYDW